MRPKHPISGNLQPLGISGFRSRHVLDRDVGCNSRSSFATNPCYCAFHRRASSSQDPCPRVSCSVVTTRIEWTATLAVTQTRRRSNDWTGLDCNPCSRTSFKPEQRPLWFCQRSEQRFPMFLFDLGGRGVLPSRLVLFLVARRPQTSRQCPPIQNHASLPLCVPIVLLPVHSARSDLLPVAQ